MQEMELLKQTSKSFNFASFPDPLRMLYKVWSAYTKFIRSLLSSNKTAVTQEFGKFTPTPQGASFFPSASFLSSGGFTYAPPPLLLVKPQEQHLSYSSISVAAGYSKTDCEYSVKGILAKAIEISRTGEVSLDFKVGTMGLKPGRLAFKGSSGNTLLCSAAISSARTPIPSVHATHPSNPNSIHQNGVGNKRYGTVPPAPPVPETIPWPYVSSFLADSARKPSKKFMIEENLSPEQLLEEHKKQINEKKQKKEKKNLEEREDGQVLINVANSELMREKEQRHNKAKALQNLFIVSNKHQIDQHKEEMLQRNTEKRIEKYDFFPFTYGSNLEKYQQKVKSKLKDEMKAKMDTEMQNYTRRNDISDAYLSSFPVFLQKDQAISTRRFEDGHIKKVMSQALNRYEKELDSIKAGKRKGIQDQFLQEEIKKNFLHQSKKLVEDALLENKKSLLDQIESDVN